MHEHDVGKMDGSIMELMKKKREKVIRGGTDWSGCLSVPSRTGIKIQSMSTSTCNRRKL